MSGGWRDGRAGWEDRRMELREMGETEAGGKARIMNTEHDYGKQEMMVSYSRQKQ